MREIMESLSGRYQTVCRLGTIESSPLSLEIWLRSVFSPSLWQHYFQLTEKNVGFQLNKFSLLASRTRKTYWKLHSSLCKYHHVLARFEAEPVLNLNLHVHRDDATLYTFLPRTDVNIGRYVEPWLLMNNAWKTGFNVNTIASLLLQQSGYL